ncbi:MAG: patatin-like phospholipase family protein [Burkholderiales bacterium]
MPVTERKKPPATPRIGLALAGGGPLGAIYEIGAMCALDEALQGIDFNDLQGYVGVSSGGFSASGLANGLTPRELCDAFIENIGPSHDVFEPSLLLQPAWMEIMQRLAQLPMLMGQAWLEYLASGGSMASGFERVARALPTGLFSNDAIDTQLRRLFSLPGRSNDFRALKRQLVVVATDVDTGQSVPFGLPGHDDVPISKAVQASAALPGLYPPVAIKGHHYVDGVLKKTLHASVLLEQGLDLLICLNPLVPYNATQHPQHRVLSKGRGRIPKLVEAGLPVVLSQTFRTLVHSRLDIGLKGYAQTYPNTTIVLFEPDQRDPQLFLANTFSYTQRRELAEHAYQQTRQQLRERRATLAPLLAHHGVALNVEVLNDPHRFLLEKRRKPRPFQSKTKGTSLRVGAAVKQLEAVLGDLENALPVVAKKAPNPRRIKG